MEAIRFESSGSHLHEARALVTERTGGVSEEPFESLNLGQATPDDSERVRENERRVLDVLGLQGPVARVRLEHGAKILYAEHGGILGVADALWTDRANLVLSLTVADCYPVAIADRDRRALVHCGWRGVAAGILEATIAALEEAAGAEAMDSPLVLAPNGSKLRAWIGPGICAECYPVGPEVAAIFPNSTRSIPGSDRSQLDLRREIDTRLRALGLSGESIASSDSCTAQEPTRFFSHRRDGFPAGRMAAFLFADHAPL